MNGLLIPSVLSGAFQTLNANGEVSRSGYFFRIFLPDDNGAGVPEPTAGFPAGGGAINSDLAETTWCVYSHPVNYNQSGNRTFFTNQGGDVIGTELGAYSGTGNGPDADAAFSVADEITSQVDIGGPGQDGAGNTWKQVG